MEHRIALSRSIAAPPSAVWRVLTDIDDAARTLSGVTGIERLDATGYEVGTRWRETRVMFGKSATEEMRVAEVEPERRTVVTAESGGTTYRTVFELAPRGDGTELSVEFSGATESPGLFTRIMMTVFGPLAMRATSKALQRDLDDIATAAERTTL
ncbi:SRPBCC family protein [Rhodococcus sp. NPDC003383]